MNPGFFTIQPIKKPGSMAYKSPRLAFADQTSHQTPVTFHNEECINSYLVKIHYEILLIRNVWNAKLRNIMINMVR